MASGAETDPLLGSRDIHSSPPTCPVANEDDETDNAADTSVSKRDLVWTLVALWLPVFLGALDATMAATLLAPIGSYFQESHRASHIGTAYLMSMCCFTPLYGRLSDVTGRRAAMLLALFLFASGTIACGLAPSMNTLILARAIAGMGGGGIMTVTSVTVTDLVPLKQRGLYQGLGNIVFGLGSGLGGPLSGWVDNVFGWRAVFLLQIPLFFISALLVAFKVKVPPSSHNSGGKNDAGASSGSIREKLARLDILGALTLAGSVGCLLLGVHLRFTEEMEVTATAGEGLSWSLSRAVWYVPIGASIVCAILFVIVERRFARLPILPLGLIARRTPLAVALADLVASISGFFIFFNLPLYFSAVKLESAKISGLHLLPHSIALSLGSVFAGWWMKRTGKLYNLTLASSLLTIVSALLITLWDDNTSSFHLMWDIAPHGFGIASVITTTLIAMISNVSKDEMAVATGVTYLFRTAGQVLGVSFSGAILQAVLLQKLRERIHVPDSSKVIDQIRRSTAILHTLPPELQRAALASYADALRVVFGCSIALNVLTTIFCAFIQEQPLPG